MFSIYCDLKSTVHKNLKIKIFNYLRWYVWWAKFEKNPRGSGSQVLKIWFTWHGMTHTIFRVFMLDMADVYDFKLPPCSECCILSVGWFPGVWILCADVSEHYSISIGGVSSLPPMKMEQCVSKRQHIKSRHRGITQKKDYNITDVFVANVPSPANLCFRR